MKTDAELYDAYLAAAKTGGAENAHKGLRAVYELGVADYERPLNVGSYSAIVEAYEADRATWTDEERAAWDARYDESGRPKAGVWRDGDAPKPQITRGVGGPR